MRRLLAVATLAFASLAMGGCFNVDKPTCSYVCADVEPRCPEDYDCRSDGYCHLTGTTGACAFSDAAMPADMSVAVPPVVDMTPAGTSD
jgi:hypothetical protein